MNIIRSAFFILILSVFISDKCYSQILNKTPLVSFHTEFNHDSVNKKSTEIPVFKMKKDPWKAVLYSALLPGAGQVYNKSYWKVPVIAGLGGYFVYGIIKNNNEYLDYKNQYQNSQTEMNPSGNPQLQYLREFYRDQRDNFIIYSLILYVVNLIDAYVDAQLYDFDVSDNIKLGILRNDKLADFKILF